MRQNGGVCLLIGLAVVSVLPGTSRGQDMETGEATVVVIHPATEPSPALKYRLVPERLSLIPGNAALYYHRANQLLALRQDGESFKTFMAKIGDWLELPADKFPKEEVKKRLEEVQHILKELELGSRQSTCDWGLDSREEGFELLIPEIQETRSLARLVALKARLEFLDGRTDQAMHWIQVGVVLGRHVSQGPSVIQSLIGLAIEQIMSARLLEWGQVPRTPSLYWALVDRPHPLIDLKPALEGESRTLERMLPKLSELDQGVWSLQETREFVAEFEKRVQSLTSGPTSSLVPSEIKRMGLGVIAAGLYPRAKKMLVAEGSDPARIDAMPIVQVSTLHAYKLFEHNRDNRMKWLNLPYWQSHGQADKQSAGSLNEKLENLLLTMFEISVPMVEAVRMAEVGLERKYDVLRCIEAIRLHAKAHDGQFPDRLEDLVESPCPIDPATGKPFQYQNQGSSAILKGPPIPGRPDHPAYKINYLLKMAN